MKVYFIAYGLYGLPQDKGTATTHPNLASAMESMKLAKEKGIKARIMMTQNYLPANVKLLNW